MSRVKKIHVVYTQKHSVEFMFGHHVTYTESKTWLVDVPQHSIRTSVVLMLKFGFI